MKEIMLLVAFGLAQASTPLGAVTASDEPISLRTPNGELHGSLKLPSRSEPVPVVLIIAGSGPTDRDGNQSQAKNDGLKMLAEELADGGIASVRYDKRGVGASRAALRSESEIVFTDLVNDTVAWIALLAADSRFASVSIIGHSEGSTIGMLAAQEGNVSSYISISGPSKRASVGLREQLRGKLPVDLESQSEAILMSLERGELVADVPPQLAALFRPSVQPYLIDWFKIVPTVEFKKLHIPCLLVQGDTDLQIRVSAAQALHDAKPDSQLAVIEGMNHVLKLAPNDPAQQMASYRDPSVPIAPALSKVVVNFLSSLRTDAKR